MIKHTVSDTKSIKIKGARVHNLKNIDLTIPLNRFIVITGLSGSGKSSLAFDTLFAEGQRRYVESLSSYARQFLGKIDKPEVDYVKGIPPAIAIEQKTNTRNPRSTVGTSTEIYDYLKLLFARIGKTVSPVSGKEVIRHQASDVVDYIYSLPGKTRVMLLSPIRHKSDRTLLQDIHILRQQGFTRIEIDGEIIKMSEDDKIEQIANDKNVRIVIDRISISKDSREESRVADSVQTAFYEGKGTCIVKVLKDDDSANEEHFSNSFEVDGIEFEEPTPHMFSFNNPVGACPKCEGSGKIIGIDEDLVIPNKSLSIYSDAIVCWKGEKMSKWKDRLLLSADKFGFPIHKPFYELDEQQKSLLWTGNSYFKGLNSFFDQIESKSYKIQYRVMLSRYRGKTRCNECLGTRIKKEAGYVKINGSSIQELINLPVSVLKHRIENIKLTSHDLEIAGRLLTEIKNRLGFLCDVGLGYLTLNRLSSSMSGGESQRINLATSLGSSLVGSMYILDEPSIGLHPRDTERLITVLRRLQQLGNTVIVVEHDEDIIRAADELIDIGPMAGINGGNIIFQGTAEKLKQEEKSITAQYLNKKKLIETPTKRRKWSSFIEITEASENNLKSIDVKFPLNIMTAVTGVSGSGKSSLVRNTLFPALNKYYGGYGEKTGSHSRLQGDMNLLAGVELVDQNPIGKSSRSNPVTYLKAYDDIRKLYADQQASKINNFKASHFSFNIDGGRCEECQGEGIIKVEMQFMADIHLTCESCKGKRFKADILEVTFMEKNINDILELTVNQALTFFGDQNNSYCKKIVKKLKPLQNVGLGYLKLGQSSSTLSGGESQRVKLAYFLSKEKSSPTLFIFDEPTTGLHLYDIHILLNSLNALINRGHTVLIIEHNLEVIKSADWIIDIGAEGGDKGGEVVFEGTPENLVKCSRSHTGKYLYPKISQHKETLR